METVSITFSDQTKQFLDHLIATGEYASIEEAVEAAVRALEAREQQRTDWINARLQEGENSGPGQPWDVEAFKERMHRSLDRD